MNSTLFFVLVLFSPSILTVSAINETSVVIGSNSFCSWTTNYLNCEDFTHMDELDLQENLNLKAFTFTSLRLAPLNKILFESDTDAFRYIRLSSDCEIILNNFGGFRAIGNPFIQTGANITKLTISDSNFVFYSEGDTIINKKECDSIDRDNIYVTIFDSCQFFSLSGNVEYGQKFCLALLNRANLKTFDITNVFDQDPNKNFTILDYDSSDSTLDLQFIISYFKLSSSNLQVLDTSILNPIMLLQQKITL